MAAKKATKPSTKTVKAPVMEPTEKVTVESKAEATRLLNRNVRAREQHQKELHKYYKGEEKVPVMFAPFYAPYLGLRVRVSTNGISVFVPCDGRTHMIPKTLAAEAHRKRMSVDKHVSKMKQGADIKNNFDGTGDPGQLRLN